MKHFMFCVSLMFFVGACFAADLVIGNIHVDLSGRDVNLQETFHELIVQEWGQNKPYMLAIVRSDV